MEQVIRIGAGGKRDLNFVRAHARGDLKGLRPRRETDLKNAQGQPGQSRGQPRDLSGNLGSDTHAGDHATELAIFRRSCNSILSHTRDNRVSKICLAYGRVSKRKKYGPPNGEFVIRTVFVGGVAASPDRMVENDEGVSFKSLD